MKYVFFVEKMLKIIIQKLNYDFRLNSNFKIKRNTQYEKKSQARISSYKLT